ncbi:arginine--tRNA ligase [Mycoplasmopsis pullorum]|nr:arginine--tRNA ligase [Mycoplasmopsis pullorum]TNK86692.1 arginine--tRNA ligase [Mycoplasmopsis pullorum]TNK88457.1 arginine--tRNA ligase [Mycoplasmopsis pullorum]TNK89057.1 arginine--tRNA ligase [Mycoplasmopsis pullorum]TNK92778.1 arginine--tRNA ligase [Mycoplasmopsis pullorum]
MNMNAKIKNMIEEIIIILQNEGVISNDCTAGTINYNLQEPNINVGDSKQYNFATNIAFLLKKYAKISVLELAQKISIELEKNELVEKADVAAPGFINIILSDCAFVDILKNIINKEDQYGSNLIQDENVYNVEFVSANPTGFLHVGHARGAAIGDSLVRVLRHAGLKVVPEYWVNDAGNQIKVLVDSAKVRYFELFGQTLTMPEDCYKGSDIIWLAEQIKNKYGNKFLENFDQNVNEFKQICIDILLEKIRTDLAKFNVSFEIFTSEKFVRDSGLVEKTLEKIKKYTYEKDGALFLNTTEFGDDKDRVLIKSDGSFTYFTPDIAYHDIKLQRSNKLINVWGADHSGYIARLKIAMQCLGYNPEDIEIIVVQLVRLIKNGQEFKMSKRAGTSVTLEDLMDVSNPDCVRFNMLTRDANTKFDFDIDLANSKDENNPVFTVQYAHSRANSVLTKAQVDYDFNLIPFNDKTRKLLVALDQFPDVIKTVASTYKIQLLTSYLMNLANLFNSFYSNNKILDSNHSQTLLAVTLATKRVLKLGLSLVGVSAPEKM